MINSEKEQGPSNNDSKSFDVETASDAEVREVLRLLLEHLSIRPVYRYDQSQWVIDLQS